MKKRIISLALILVMALSLVPAAYAQEVVAPAPPSWIDPAEYIVFDGSELYEPENWKSVLECRAYVESLTAEEIQAGKAWYDTFKEKYMAFLKVDGAKLVLDGGDPAACFEVGLMHYGLFLKGHYSNEGNQYIRLTFSNLEPGFEDTYQLLQWGARASCWRAGPDSRTSANYDLLSYMASFLPYEEFDRKEFLAHSDFDNVRDTEDFAKNYNIFITLDDRYLTTDTAPEIVNNRTLAPIRPIAEAIGADVEWNGESQTITLSRAGKLIELTLGSSTAIVNGEPVELDVAPYTNNGRTLLPLRFISEAFSQSVEYNGKNPAVIINEDLSFAGDSNIKSWMLGCSAIINKSNKQNPYAIGGGVRDLKNVEHARQLLGGSWGIYSHDGLVSTIEAMTDQGHNTSFLLNYAIVSSLSDSDYKKLLKNSTGIDAYMWPLTKELGEKWGDTGIAAWDWYRMVHLATWGYLAGYVELSEAYELTEKQAIRLRETFSSWDEATENYMDGYAWWSRTDVSESNTTYKRRLAIYENLKAAEEADGLLFDPSVWNEPVKGIK